MQKLPDKKVMSIEKGYNPGITYVQLGDLAEVSPATAFANIKYGSTGAYLEQLARSRGFKNYYDYLNYQARKEGFKSAYERTKFLAEKRQQNPKYKELSTLINTRLKELGKDQKWLTKKLRVVTKSMTSLYAQGKSYPSKEIEKKLRAALA